MEGDAERADAGRGLRHGLRAEPDNVGAGPGQRLGDGAPEPGARAGDEGAAAGEVEQLGAAHQASSAIGTKSMSAKDWLSPAIAQMKA